MISIPYDGRNLQIAAIWRPSKGRNLNKKAKNRINSENHRASVYTRYEVDWVIGIPDNDGKPKFAAIFGYQIIEIWYKWPQIESYLKNTLIQHDCEEVNACVKLDKIKSFVELWYFQYHTLIANPVMIPTPQIKQGPLQVPVAHCIRLPLGCGSKPIYRYCLTLWGWDKMAAIFQTTFSNAFSWIKMCQYQLKFHWNLFPWFQLTISQHWFG